MRLLARWQEVRSQESRPREIDRALRGDSVAAQRVEPRPPTITSRVFDLSSGQIAVPLPPTKTRQESYQVATAEFGAALAKLRALVKEDLPKLERQLDAAGVPPTPGRLPDWEGM